MWDNRARRYEYVDEGLKPHRHVYKDTHKYCKVPEKWYIHRQWRGRYWVMTERIMCLYDGCGKFKERPLKRPFCKHCGQTK